MLDNLASLIKIPEENYHAAKAYSLEVTAFTCFYKVVVVNRMLSNRYQSSIVEEVEAALQNLSALHENY